MTIISPTTFVAISNQIKEIAMFTHISSLQIEAGRPFLVILGILRMIARVRGRAIETADVAVPADAHNLPDGLYLCPDELVAGAVWSESRKAYRALLKRAFIVVVRGHAMLKRLERVEEGITWNHADNSYWLAAALHEALPENVQNGIFPCPKGLAAEAVWPVRRLFNVSEFYGDRFETSPRDIRQLCKIAGWVVPKLHCIYTSDDYDRSIREYVDISRNEVVLRDEWFVPAETDIDTQTISLDEVCAGEPALLRYRDKTYLLRMQDGVLMAGDTFMPEHVESLETGWYRCPEEIATVTAWREASPDELNEFMYNSMVATGKRKAITIVRLERTADGHYVWNKLTRQTKRNRELKNNVRQWLATKLQPNSMYCLPYWLENAADW